ncbi:hypothetical protein SLA2020_317480 [Shorea laevis]
MAAPLLLRGFPLLRLRLHHQVRLAAGLLSVPRRPWCANSESASSEEDASVADKTTTELSFREPPKYDRWNSPDYRKWKDEEEQILRDIEPIVMLTKEILHSDQYGDGESLTAEDERAVVEKLLSYHPHSEDKIGCGLDSIMVDHHPQFRSSRCLFVVRTDGGWIDFSYKKCLRAYIQDNYPSYGERFIQKHFKRGSG